MDTSIIELVMGLVLVYAVLALLLMKVQESVFGNFMRARVTNLHALVREATMQDEALAKAIYANPLIFPLSPGEGAKPSHWSLSLLPFSRSTGPSSIPPALFAQALLMELNGGTHPRHNFSTPLGFVDDQLKAAALATPRQRLLRALHGQVANRETSWVDFEAALALWFQDIGDRSDGWFKRSSDRFAFRAALLLCALLNVDTLNMVNVLGADAELRTGLADLAEEASRLRDSEAGASAPAPDARRQPARANASVRVSAGLVDANAYLREAFFKDEAIARYGHDLQPLRDYCDVIPEVARYRGTKQDPAGRAAMGKRYASNSDAWLDVLPGLLPVIESAVLGLQGGHTFNPDQPLSSEVLQSTAKAVASMEKAIQAAGPARKEMAPAVQAASAASAAAAAALKAGNSSLNSDRGKLARAQHCLIQVSSWVRAASTASDRPETRKVMQEAAVALEESKSALRELIAAAAPSGGSAQLRRLFLAQPSQFQDCLGEKPASLDTFLSCLRDNQSLSSRLPIGWGESNRQRQFCRVALGPSSSSGKAPPTATDGVVADWPCSGTARVDPTPALGLHGTMALAPLPWAWFQWGLGVLISAIFVALGAPFWFDMLSRLVKLRAAGQVRGADEDEAKARGSRPLPSLAGTPAPTPGGQSSPAGGLAGQPGVIAGPQGSKNAFEDRLLAREVMALQAALGVTQTAAFDTATRDAIRKAQGERGLGDSDELSLASYTALVRRPPEQAGVDLGDLPTRPTRGQPHPYLPALRDNLLALLGLPQKIDATVFNDDLRALAVLYRVKQELDSQAGAKHYATLDAVELADSAPAVLDQLDEAWMNRILASRSTSPALGRDIRAAWMDWAWGELGQVEKDAESTAASNPRICSYLKEAGLPNSGDKTPWCAAFVAWVLKRHNEFDQPNPAEPLVPDGQSLTLAASWRTWHRARAGHQAPAYGDVVVVERPGSTPAQPLYHVGFFVEAADGTYFWMLGGNQSSGGRVCLSRWPSASIRPVPAPPAQPAQ